MKTVLLIAWLAAPIGVAAYHYGPGQDQLKREQAAVSVGTLHRAAAEKDWDQMLASAQQALTELPTGDTATQQRLRLTCAQAKMHLSALPEATSELEALLAEFPSTSAATDPDSALRAETRATLASAKYYMTWLMRLEGQGPEAWEPEIEASRQHYRLLAEQSAAAGDTVGQTKHQEDLEASIKLARMDLTELQGLPLPGQ
jgi:hypothetical protein